MYRTTFRLILGLAPQASVQIAGGDRLVRSALSSYPVQYDYSQCQTKIASFRGLIATRRKATHLYVCDRDGRTYIDVIPVLRGCVGPVVEIQQRRCKHA